MGKIERDKRYRDKHRAAISIKRKLRYKLDDSFREEKKQIERERYRMKKGQARQIQPKLVTIDGKVCKLYPIGFLSEKIQVPPSTVRTWFDAKILPDATLVDDAGRRWFSLDYVNKITKAHTVYTLQKEVSLKKLKDIIDSL